MARERSPWRALRPVLLAGAATFTWLTFSATAASADALPDAASLLGGVTASISSVADKLPVPDATAPAAVDSAAQASSAGLLKPIGGEVSVLADDVAASVPVVSQVVPAGTVSAVSRPVVQAADTTAAEAVKVVAAPVFEVVPVLEAVLQPVSDAVTGTAPLPVPLPDLDGVVAHKDVEQQADSFAMVAGAAETSKTAPANTTETVAPGAVASTATIAAAATSVIAGSSDLVSAGSSGLEWVLAEAQVGEQPDTNDPSSFPFPAPAVPASGTGSGASSGASSGAAAWLSPFDLDLPVTGPVDAGELLKHIPAPVSHDPGSSPD
ncbi:hypothetical protein [Pseudarthrobacter sp. NamB4]|uniref:hypothetical protein n=1 Tax=Pseudarthrobacter sp. NamB4 TaxID=2576837 RepID=UPI0010FE24B3|nr:hypothetical protein [Pseudarthrobacter sp. NamB4]TLM73281.1 hypothetical protein FDW81_09645 [Pseudarthrobacter sp. NamB4]